MYRLTAAGLLAVAGLAVAAPRLKDPPNKDPIIGQWRLVSVNGAAVRGVSHTETFLEDGTRIKRVQVGRSAPDEYRTRYTTDAAAEPARVDFHYARRADPDKGVYKVEGDTLTICFRVFPNDRPPRFGPEVREGSLMVYERVKPKE